jgi:hypothetical protein
MLPFYSLDQLKDPEVMKMCDTQCETINTRDNKRSDLPLFREHQGVAGDGAKSEIHNLVGNAIVISRAVAFEQAAEVAIRDHAD